MALERSPESISTQNEFELILGQLSKTCDDRLIRKLINWAHILAMCRKGTDLVYDPKWPNLKLMGVSSRQTFWPIFKSIEQEMWPLEHPQGNSLI